LLSHAASEVRRSFLMTAQQFPIYFSPLRRIGIRQWH